MTGLIVIVLFIGLIMWGEKDEENAKIAVPCLGVIILMLILFAASR